jgi:hypothetical protein
MPETGLNSPPNPISAMKAQRLDRGRSRSEDTRAAQTAGQVQEYIVLGQGQPASFLEDGDQHLEALVFKARAVALGLAKIGR